MCSGVLSVKGYRIQALCRIESSFNSQKTHGHPTFSFQADKIVFNSDYGKPRGVPDAYVMPISNTPSSDK
jgi:hypothetical protein